MSKKTFPLVASIAPAPAVAPISIAANQPLNSKELLKLPELTDRVTEELVFAVVGPVGSGCTSTIKLVEEILSGDFGYAVTRYKLSQVIEDSLDLIGQASPVNLTDADRIEFYQTAGDAVRKKQGNDYLIAKTIEKILRFREDNGLGRTAGGVAVAKKIRHVHLIDSLKHPEELDLLRKTYGDIFWLIGVFAPDAIRKDRLSNKHIDAVALAQIMQRDYMEIEAHGQKVREVFYQSDFFIRNDQPNKLMLKAGVERFLNILFGAPIHTPTDEESAMYTAYAEASKSACLSRQVGAAIVSQSGEVIGKGRNDVPKFKGGLYSENDSVNDYRCHAWKDRECHNDRKKDELYTQIFNNLNSSGLLSPSASVGAIVQALKGTEVKSLIEFSRAVHAEMDAITSVARTQKPGLIGGTLYSTTFPCHSCARHIVASGIHTVYFIEPYPKSLAVELHMDSVSENEADKESKVVFLQYSGIAPKNILKLFRSGLTRKNSNGKLAAFERKTAVPVVRVSLDDYSTHEKWVVAKLLKNETQAIQPPPTAA